MRPLLDLLVPPRCLACRRVAPGPLCDPCGNRLDPDDVPHPLAPDVVAVAAYAYADPLAAAIKRVKTDALRAGAADLARLLADHLPAGVPTTWVPATARRRRRRGLDLPELLAGPAATRLLVATRDRPDHGSLDAAARRRGTADAYRATGPAPRAVVLVDDVRATGATLLAAADALVAAGAERVLCVTLAASPGPPSAARGAPPRRRGRGRSTGTTWARSS